MPHDIVAIARTWIGVPFRHQGRARTGVDCGGLVLCVGRECGIDIEEPPTYSQSPEPWIFDEWLNRYCVQESKRDIAPGMIAHITFAGEPRHLAIVSDIGLIHAWIKPGKVVEHAIDQTWSRRIASVWRIK